MNKCSENILQTIILSPLPLPRLLYSGDASRFHALFEFLDGETWRCIQERGTGDPRHEFPDAFGGIPCGWPSRRMRDRGILILIFVHGLLAAAVQVALADLPSLQMLGTVQMVLIFCLRVLLR